MQSIRISRLSLLCSNYGTTNLLESIDPGLNLWPADHPSIYTYINGLFQNVDTSKITPACFGVQNIALIINSFSDKCNNKSVNFYQLLVIFSLIYLANFFEM